MAQTIITLCDPHLTEDDQQVAGLPYRLGVNLPGESRWSWTEVDLCPEHAEALTDVALFLAKYGRAFTPDGTPKAGRKAVALSGATQARICPQCGKTLKTQDSLTKHVHRIHEGPHGSGPWVCDEDGCGREFLKRQALSMHKRRTHQGFDPNRVSR